MDTLLLEIGTEEIPARFLPKINIQLAELVAKKFADKKIPYDTVKVYSTPRRLAFLLTGLAKQQPDNMLEAKGPALKIAKTPEGEYSKAAQGFARSQGVDLADLVEKDGYIYAVKKLLGQNVQDLLPELLLEIIQELNFPKNMRWANYDIRFVRPIHWLVALLNEQVIPLTIAEVSSGNFTYGHRFLSAGKITLKHAQDYVETLRAEHVIVDPNEREAMIVEQIKTIAQQNQATAKIDEELLEEVVYLVEYPTALCGHFDPEFLVLPKEAIITPMKEHQRYFPLFSEKTGELMPMFITVRNGNDYNLAVIAHGNARVLRARLSDASFFFNEDRKQKLEIRLQKLKNVVFQDGLGSMYDKVERIEKLAVRFAQMVDYQDLAIVKHTAHLAKADLVTGMVCEFTELQGIMGREYAKLEGEAPLVYEGIFEHYLPRFAGDILPSTATGIFVGLADKIDNIVATFSRGLIPTGSQDPYALRRQALGIVNVLANSTYKLPLDKIIMAACETLNISGQEQQDLTAKLQEFFTLRVKNLLIEQGLRYDLVDAILAMQLMDMQDTLKRAKAIKEFAVSQEFVSTVQAFVRVANLTKNVAQAGVVREEKLLEAAEIELCKQFNQQKTAIEAAITEGEYLVALQVINKLVEPINYFFEKVMVMDKDEEIKNNRLALLVNIRELVLKIVDFTKVVLG
ncbi:glycine--tRNA ligase subunit beta [Succinispira mobilis]|uniref:glycine--tRNA ligase subunit beta n=1 Tax=Succinispira mobilis TaxID=78120 RepID=UPI00037E6D8E|nr:glycine--tRNA ligase subunit beta [Succinispira mobilis]